VRLLLDTHAVLWWLSDDPRLAMAARTAIADPANQQKLRRLPPLPEILPDRLLREGVEILPISIGHALAAAALPGPHRDPWDRIMMAQALAEQCRVVTVDKVFSDYKIPVLW
jgi:PIN domain nuclease of toxin-antitoxin system